MGWGLGDIGLTIATGGAYGAAKVYNDSQKEDPGAVSRARDLYNNQTMSDANQAGQDKIKKYLGSSMDNIGADVTDAHNMMKANVNKNVAKADIYNQQAGLRAGVNRAKAGLSGVDTSAADDQSAMNAKFGAAALNENAKSNALSIYNTSLGNKISSANQMDMGEKALAIAQMKQPETNYTPGLLGSLFGAFV